MTSYRLSQITDNPLSFNNMKKALKLIALFAYIGAVILASAGAMNYAHETSQTIYTVAGVINLLFGGYNAFKEIKNNTIFNTQK